jgi:hypothetical protein
MSPLKLMKSDCHSNLRQRIVADDSLVNEVVCVSIAWDWLFLGHSSKGIEEEMSVSLEAARINSTKGLHSLSVAEVCLIYLAIEYLSQYEAVINNVERTSFIFDQLKNAAEFEHDPALKRARALTVLKGILPSFSKMVKSHHNVLQQLENSEYHYSICQQPIANEYRQSVPTNPFGNDYFCKVCHIELSNIYMHCDGCEDILCKDYNICTSCFTKGQHMGFYDMNATQSENKWSCFHHIVGSGSSQCDCEKAAQQISHCQLCSLCCACSCTCHQLFTLHYRFLTIEEEQRLLRSIQRSVKGK